MMGGRQVEQAALSYEFSLERHVPQDHLRRAIDGNRPVRRPLVRIPTIAGSDSD